MMSSGKIEAAIERLKQIRESTGRHPLPDINSSRRARKLELPAAEPPSMPEPPLVDYDRTACGRHRILLPGAGNVGGAGAVSAYRQLRTRILQRARANQWATIGVTSPGPGQGKTINSINIAINIAREKNNNVFLLDLDLRNPSICRYLGLQPPLELLRYFEGNAKPEDVFFSIGVENLRLAGGTVGIDHSSELLATGKVEALFAYIKKVAPQPLVIVDMPPVLSNDDALVVAPKVDGVMIVISQGVSRRDAVAHTMDLMRDFNIAGLVLNRSDSLITEYYGYGS